MAYNKKTWLARIGQGLNKFIFNNQSTKVTLESAPDSVSQQGDALSAANMNDLETRIDNEFTAVESLIPNQASSSNQLADKSFVNSSVSTNTANYISDNGNPFTSASNLPTSGVTNNDYAFVTGTDSAGNTYYDRYKATVSGSSVSWAKEYRLNNSSFTSDQWAAISSGITGTLVTNYSSHVSNSDIHVTTSDKSTWSGKYNKPSTGIPKTDLDSSVQTSLGKADTAIQSHQSLAAYVQGPASSVNNRVATFDGTGGKTIKDSGYTIGKSVPSDAVFTDTTYESKSASSGGTAVSLVTTGEKYTWNNKGSYSKPSGGIPKTDLASAVQTSLDKADTALQSHQSLADYVKGPSTSTDAHVATFNGTGGKIIKDSGYTIAKSVPSDAKFTDTTYESKSASSGGTAVSLVTTGEKYTWNNKGSYSKPSGGIPKTDLASGVQTSLGLADTALQSHQSLAAYVQGPSSSTDAHVATFNGTGGKTIQDSGFTIGKSVPSDAKFTDTNTKVTSANNHYTPSYSSTESASGATGTSGATVQVVTGVQIDSKGHVTGVVSGAATDTTYSSKSAASGGTAVSLVTTGEKYTWNNKGSYSKPSGGIPSSDLASAVQTSLGKADSALQTSDIYDGTDSTATNKALSANQGKVLGDAINAINNSSGVAEKGGDYIRFNNGLQICWGLKHVDFNSWVQWGSIYETDIGTALGFPKAFISIPSISCSARLNTGATCGAEIGSFDRYGISDVYALRPIKNYATSYEVSFIAIGSWK